MTVRTREATEADWTEIWPIVESVCRAGETFTFPRDVTEAFGRTLWMLSPPGVTFVAVDDDDRIIGTAKAGPNHMGPGAHVATASFMVAADARGRGPGRRLAETAIAHAQTHGFQAMQFNAVVESNRSAVRLWQALGFEIIGTAPDAFAHPLEGFVGLHIMYRRL